MHDISYDGVSSDLGMSLSDSFGKIYKGEQIKTMLTIMNKHPTHPLERVRIKVTTFR